LRAFRDLNALPEERRRAVFFSHGSQDWPHLWPLAFALATGEGVHVAYVCAMPDDPALEVTQQGITTFLLDGNMLRAWALRTVAARVLITTLPDLGIGPWKRSAQVKYYVYVPHSLASCHMIYRQRAFEAFDEVFCAGPHHATELRVLEALNGSPRKILFNYGYPRLDTLIAEARSTIPSLDAPQVLVAPSWGPAGLFETLGVEIISRLLSAGCRITLRPHPETIKRSPHCIRAILNRFGSDSRLVLDQAIEAYGSLLSADVMISDWSGAALEFAFGLERPVIFIDTPRKVNNPGYERVGVEPLEVVIRSELGTILPLAQIDSLPALARALAQGNDAAFKARARSLRKQCVHNLGVAAAIGARRLRELLYDDRLA
jgi:YidC/Oxa1 family membrane protein insertase